MFWRSVVPRTCQHKTHWWPHWRLCFRKYMLNDGCRKHYRQCYFGHSEVQRQAAHAEIVRAIVNGEVNYRKVRRRDEASNGDGAQAGQDERKAGAD